MIQSWRKVISLPSGGTISSLSIAGNERIWAGSPAGLFMQQNGVVKHKLGEVPSNSISAVLAMEKLVLVAGYPNLIIRSADGGNSWYRCWTEHIETPVTCFAPSLNFSRDATILAGSDGEGILRSLDGGKSWQLSNFGLRSFTVLDITWAPPSPALTTVGGVVLRREPVYAATENGVYFSPNAGRAWRQAGEGLPSVPVLSLAVVTGSGHCGPALGSVFAGTDGAGLYRSQDGGNHWMPVTTLSLAGVNMEQTTINALYGSPQGMLFVGVGEYGILASPDCGETWHPVLSLEDDVVLRITGYDATVFAGTGERGLMISEDHGLTWQVGEYFSARLATHFAAREPVIADSHTAGAGQPQPGSREVPRPGTFLIAGPTEGLWAYHQAAWQKISQQESWLVEPQVISLRTTAEGWLALTPHSLLFATDPTQEWNVICESPVEFSTLVCEHQAIIVGKVNGEILLSLDTGRTWKQIPVPAGNASIMALHLRQEQNPGILAVTWNENKGLVDLWHAENPGKAWTLAFQQRSNWPSVFIASAPSQDNPGVLLVIDSYLFLPGKNGWHRKSIPTPDAPVLAFLSLPEQNLLLLSKPGRLLVSQDQGNSWQDAELHETTITAMIPSPENADTIYALSSTGVIYTAKC